MCDLIGNVHFEKMVNTAEERVGKVMRMFRVNGQVEVDRERMVWELIGRPSMKQQQKCGGHEGVVCAGSWSRHR